MSFIIAVHVNEGIVLASDRRTTYTRTQQNGDRTIERIGIHVTNSAEKTFVCPNGAGISMCGDASLNNKPLSGFLKEIIRSKIEKDTPVQDMPQIISDGFDEKMALLDTNLIIAGYDKNSEYPSQVIKRLFLRNKSVEDIGISAQGAVWDGETTTLSRLLQDVAVKSVDGHYEDLPYEGVSWQYFTLQDAVDFARYAVNVTIETMHFKDMVETVGGGVDLLVITPDKTWWIEKAQLS
jgi:hypothetical protein